LKGSEVTYLTESVFIAMAKNTSSSAFRKIDVDAFNEDNYRDEDNEPASAADVADDEISALIGQGKPDEAIRKLLSSAPIGNKDQNVKDAALNLMMRSLLAVRQNQVEGIVKSLDNDQRDILMKYIYRGFEIPSEGSSGQLLLWHEKVFETGGVGSIVRVLTDRKKV
jgi:actin related protein 2/3 complex subunit 5